MGKDKRDVYIAIQVAMANGRGLHLTSEEVVQLSLVGVLEEAAYVGLLEREGVDITKLELDELMKVKP